MNTPASKRITDTAALDRASSPELRDYHDKIFNDAPDNSGEIYGSPADWSPLKASGHFRRIKILDDMDLGSMEGKVAVDFGTGPWGFACIFPKLRNASRCIGFDVSLKALELTAERDKDIAARTTYSTSDGDRIPLEDNTVDIFWGGEVIEHVREPRLFLQEIARICRDGGRVILSTPNRDAVYYYANGEDCTIGPEHIALLNYTQLEQLMKLFFSRFSIVGYETSLFPQIDDMLSNPTVLELIQDRAAVHPQSASGLIVEAFVSKDLFEKNKLTYELEEFLWSDERVAGSGNCESLVLFGDINGGSISANTPLNFEARGDRVIMLFWAHPWSGNVVVTVGGLNSSVNLYSPLGGFRRVEFELPDQGPHDICIKRTNTKPEAAKADQTIFYKVMAYSRTKANRRS